MAGQAQRTLRELANPNVIQQPLSIQFPTTDATFELNSGLIHLLPTFRGLVGEDPHKHMKEFHIGYTAMKPQGITEEQISLRAFPFSLADKAKDWLYYLPSGSITTWDNMKQQFFDKFFPASRAANIRKYICGIRQLHGETLYEYWERFKQLCASCLRHQIPEQLLVQYFYKGLSLFDRNMIVAASGGALVNKTPQEARALISNTAVNAQQFSTRKDNHPRQSMRYNRCKDPGMFTMPCVIGNLKIERAMLDLGAFINVMPYSIYCALNLGRLKQTRVLIQLADRSNAYPEGVVEDVLVQVKELIFPADFDILRMEEDSAAISAPILLGGPFMKTAITKIDVEEGTLSVEFDGEIECFEETYEIDSFHMQAQLEVEGEIAEAWEISETDEESQTVIYQTI
ncbi:uncharacterized protein [Primulina eburnea]|uniref:uncharacterized protein n=1 Tax=Primulina eburnea TaxID=1245227 RepID=UPI003C6CAA61